MGVIIGNLRPCRDDDEQDAATEAAAPWHIIQPIMWSALLASAHEVGEMPAEEWHEDKAEWVQKYSS